MVEIAICDDEEIIIERLTDLIKKQNTDCHIESFQAENELLAAKRRFDLIFLDIQMDGINGIETAKAVREHDRKAVIIFVTAIKEYVFEAFDVGAFHYLLKPIAERKFTEVFENAVREISERRIRRETPALFIKTKNKSYTLNQCEIIFIEIRNRKAAIHTAKNTLEVYAVMKELCRRNKRNIYC